MDNLSAEFPSPKQGLVSSVPTLSIQSVLFRNDAEAVFRSLLSIGRATELALTNGAISSAEILYGDCTTDPIFCSGQLEKFAAQHAPHLRLTYKTFLQNLGSAAGHNQLTPLSAGEVIVIQNPDIVPAPDTYTELLRPFGRIGVGVTEARQLPIEHPKTYNATTGETGWATTACAMIPRKLLLALHGFDADSFFLYCDDVDLSWRVRLAGFKVIYQPSAAVFHNKSLSITGRWEPTVAEQYYSAEAAILMAHKWSRPNRVARLLKAFAASTDQNLQKAASEYNRRLTENKLCQPIDPQHSVGEFNADDTFTLHRYSL